MTRMMLDRFLYAVTIFQRRARSFRGQRVIREAVSTIHHMRYPHASGDDPKDTEHLSLKSTAAMLPVMLSIAVIMRVRNMPYLQAHASLENKPKRLAR